MAQVKPITLYTAAAGLNTRLDPQRLTQGTKDAPGLIELSQAVNVSIDDRGLIALREGSSLILAGDFHSLFSSGGEACFVVKNLETDSAIYNVHPVTRALTGVRSGLMRGARVCFTKANDSVFYANGAQNGFIRDGVSFPWPVSAYNGEDAGIELQAAPIGRHIAFKNGGFMFIAVGNALWANHIPFNFGLYSMATGFIQLEGDIVMVCPVDQGVFVSDSKATWFFRGNSCFDFVQTKVADYPAIEWSLAHDEISLRDIGMDMPGNARCWGSQEGVCLGTDDGTFINLTKRQIKYPPGRSSGACLVTDTHIIHTSN